MRHIVEGRLIHVYEKASRGLNGDIQRHGLQVLYTPQKGVVSDFAELDSPLLPKGANPNRYIQAIGQEVKIFLKAWESDTQHGHFIEDERNIIFKEQKGQK